jgi:hypothetical protein
MNINYVIFIVAILISSWHQRSINIIAENFKASESGYCDKLDQRDCYAAPHCGWCVDSDQNGRCKEGDSLGPNKTSDCNRGWTTGWPWSKINRVPFHYYYPSSWWGINWNPFVSPWRYRMAHDRDFRRKIRRLRRGGW